MSGSDTPSTNLKLKMEIEMVDLYHSIKSPQTDSPPTIIQFLGSHKNEGTSTITREFAGVLTWNFDKSTLLLDVNQNELSQHRFFRIKSEHSLEQAIQDNKHIDRAIYQIAGSKLFLGRIFESSDLSPHFLNTPGIKNLLMRLKQQFDYVLIDSPPVAASAIGVYLSKNTDGTVLVFEADKTRWPVINNIKLRIEKNGGKVLGLVLNKRKYYIPMFIYKNLL